MCVFLCIVLEMKCDMAKLIPYESAFSGTSMNFVTWDDTLAGTCSVGNRPTMKWSVSWGTFAFTGTSMNFVTWEDTLAGTCSVGNRPTMKWSVSWGTFYFLNSSKGTEIANFSLPAWWCFEQDGEEKMSDGLNINTTFKYFFWIFEKLHFISYSKIPLVWWPLA